MALAFKVVIAVVTGVLGVIAAIADSRDTSGRLTKAGRLLLISIAMSTFLSIGLLLQDRTDELARDDAARRQFATQLTKHELTLQRLGDVVTRQEILVGKAEATLRRVSSVDSTLLVTARQSGDIQMRSAANLTATQNMLSKVNKLLNPLSVEAIDVRIEYNLDSPEFHVWSRRVRDFVSEQNQGSAEAGRPILDFDLISANRDYALEYRANRLTGIRLREDSPLWPSGKDEFKAQMALGCACLKIWFESSVSNTKRTIVEDPSQDIILPLHPALAFSVDDNRIPFLRRPGATLARMNRQWKSADHPVVPGFEIVVDLDANRVTRHVVILRPTPLLNTKRIASVTDLIGGVVWYEIPDYHMPYYGRLASVRLFLDDSLSAFIDLPTNRLTKPLHRPNTVARGLWRVDLTADDVGTWILKR